MGLPDDVRSACAQVAARARRVRIAEAAIEPYAATLGGRGTEEPLGGDPAFSLQLNAVNFGSGWFPTLRKLPGLSGYRTVEAGLRAHGPWPAHELIELTAADVAAVVGQDPGHELMGLFADALRELGAHVTQRHGGSFAALVAAHLDAVALAEELAALPMWRDVAAYDGLVVPFYKRAQIAAAALVAPGRERLTIFADNLVPHVLRLDGVLEFDDDLVARIDAGELLEHGSPEEVEIRACALHAVELLVAAHGATTAADADWVLWERGAGPRYKARPRHRARTTAY
jgi:hypothetical protein